MGLRLLQPAAQPALSGTVPAREGAWGRTLRQGSQMEVEVWLHEGPHDCSSSGRRSGRCRGSHGHHSARGLGTVLGRAGWLIAPPPSKVGGGPATPAGAGGGRVPRGRAGAPWQWQACERGLCTPLSCPGRKQDRGAFSALWDAVAGFPSAGLASPPVAWATDSKLQRPLVWGIRLLACARCLLLPMMGYWKSLVRLPHSPQSVRFLLSTIYGPLIFS